MAYKLRVTDSAHEDLTRIAGYIIEELCNPPAAFDLLEQVERSYRNLAESPEMYSLCRKRLLSRMGFRKIAFGGYVMIYRFDPVQGIVYIERFFSGLEDYESKL